MDNPETLAKVLKTLENIEGLLSDMFSAYTLGTRDIHSVYRNKRDARKRRRAGGSHTREQWKALKRKYDYRCLACGQQEPDIKLTRDHVDPEGTDDIDNIQPLCEDCNRKKDNQVIDYRKGYQPPN